MVSFSELAGGSGSASSVSFATSANKYENVWKPDTKPMFANVQQTTEDDKDQSEDKAEVGEKLTGRPRDCQIA